MGRPDNVRFLAAWRERDDQERRGRVHDALGRLARRGRLNLAALHREARVSRQWLYDHGYDDEIKKIQAELAGEPARRSERPQGASEESLKRRLESALDDNRRLRAKNEALESDLARALGEVRTFKLRYGG